MDRIKVEVAYATAQLQEVVALILVEGARAIDAVRASDLAARHPGFDPDAAALGIFGKIVPPDTGLSDGDRVEIYRPLLADPKDARRTRAAQQPKAARPPQPARHTRRPRVAQKAARSAGKR